MAKIVKPLTNTQLENAKPKAKEYSLADGNGLLLRIKPTGTKVWLFNYTHPYTGKRKNIALGKYPALKLVDARKMREDNLSLLAKSLDPKEYRDNNLALEQEKHSNTLFAVASRWFEVKRTQVSPSYAVDIWRSLELHVLPSLGKAPLSQITAKQAIEVLNPLAAKGSLETVKRVCQRLNEVMYFATNTGIILNNPLAAINKAFEAPKATNLPSLAPDQLPRVMSALSTANIKIVTRCLIEWQLHTMVRPSEAAKAEWSEIDLVKRTWTIPAEKMKKSSNGDHVVPLTDQTLALLEYIKPISGHRPFIFPSDRNPLQHANSSTANMALKRMGFKQQLVAHGLRSLASSTLNEQGFDADVIETCLAHVDSNTVRRAYNRTDYLERRRTVMDWWSSHIENAANGNLSLGANAKTLNVVNFK
ncbi:integrase domain-containing protein [Glaciecola sp. 2405UD65-10]|uniref:integrase domain-containing protein n=1 Tax=Glaciecola sp. 2405UD65-10 TaxID=3397244 RepID=UPI003B5A4D3C